MRADMAAENGKIVRIAEEIAAGPSDTVSDCAGMLILPGMIDGHTHFDMEGSGTVTADDFTSGTAAAVLGGTTAVIDFVTQDRGRTLADALRAWHAKADGKCSCHYGFHMSVTDWNEQTKAELPDMFAEGISSFKLYLAYDNLRVSDAAVYEILTEMKRLGGIVGVHCENGDLVAEGQKAQKRLGITGPAGHPASRPPVVEAEAVRRLLAISELTGCTVNIVHLSGAAGLEEVRRFRAAGHRVRVETCPQYLFLNDSVYHLPGFESGRYVCSPPVRPEADRAALTEALLRGEIDTVSTDHCSYTLAQKEAGIADFTKIPNGMPGVEHRAELILGTLVADGRMPVTQAVRLLAAEPARQFGMYPEKGVLREGSDADIVVYDPDKEWTVTAAAQHQRTDYTPFEGMRLKGKVRDVYLMGRQAVAGGELVARGLGEYLRRKPVEV